MAEPTLDILVRLKDLFTGNLKKVGQEVDKADKRITKGFGGMTKGAGALAGKLKALAAAYIGWVGVQKLWDAAKDYAKLSALTEAYERMSGTINANMESVDLWRDAVKKTVGVADILKQVMVGMHSGLIQNEADFLVVAKAARVLARTTGEEVLPKLQALVQQLGAGSTRSLRQIGLDMEEVFRQHKALTGVELPLETKQRLMLVELAKKLKGELGEIAKAEANTNEQLQQAKALWDDSAENIGKASEAMIELNKESAKLWEQFTKEHGENIASGLNEITKGAKDALSYVKALGDAIGVIIGHVELLAQKGPRAITPAPHPRSRGLPSSLAEATQSLSPIHPIKPASMYDKGDLIERLTVAPLTAAETKMLQDSDARAMWPEHQPIMPEFSVMESQQQIAATYTSTADAYEVAAERQLTTMERILNASEQGVIQYQDMVGDAFHAWSDAVIDMMGATETAIGSVFFDAMMGRMQSFKDYLRSWLSDIARAISQYMAKMVVGQVIGAGLNAAFGALGGLFGSGTGLGPSVSPQAMGGANTFNDSIMSAPQMPGFFAKGYGAEGGIASEPGFYGLAESGEPEGIVPLTRNRAIPVELKGGARNVTIIYAPRIEAMDGDSVRRVIHQYQDAFLAPVYQALGTNPTFRSAVRDV